jgi:hypothetical protein
MKVSELINKLQGFQQDRPVKLNWEGEIVEIKTVVLIDVKQYHPDEDHGSEDYWPELELEDEAIRYKAVLIN